jgi:hypothetical protein
VCTQLFWNPWQEFVNTFEFYRRRGGYLVQTTDSREKLCSKNFVSWTINWSMRGLSYSVWCLCFFPNKPESTHQSGNIPVCIREVRNSILGPETVLTKFCGDFPESLQEKFLDSTSNSMLGGSMFATAWRALRLRMEETPSKYGGKLRIY